MSVVIDGTNGVTASASFLGTGPFTGSYSDGIVADYTTGVGRISVGASDAIAFYRGGIASTESMRIDSSGNVGIGTSSPVSQLHLVSASDSGMTIYKSAVGAGNVRVVSQGGGSALAFGSDQATGTTERMRIDSSGNVGIGTSSPIARFTVNGGEAAIQGATSTGGTISFYNNGASTNGFRVGQGFATGSDNIAFLSNQANADMVFRTNATERMRIDSSGNLMVGTTSSDARLVVVNTVSGKPAAWFTSGYAGDVSQAAIYVLKTDNNSTTSQVFQRFYINNGGAASGQIVANGANAAAFASTSDQRVKENIVDLPPQLDKVMNLRPVEFDYIESLGGGHQIGFIAQEMQQVFPDAVSADDSEDQILSVTGWSKTEAILVKAIQEQQAIIQQLRADVAQLKGQA